MRTGTRECESFDNANAYKERECVGWIATRMRRLNEDANAYNGIVKEENMS